jgi:hypothetical protein
VIWDLGFWFSVFGFWFLVFGFKFQISNFKFEMISTFDFGLDSIFGFRRGAADRISTSGNQNGCVGLAALEMIRRTGRPEAPWARARG